MGDDLLSWRVRCLRSLPGLDYVLLFAFQPMFRGRLILDKTVEHNLNLAGILDSARARIIDHAPARALPKRAQALSKNAQASEGEGVNE